MFLRELAVHDAYASNSAQVFAQPEPVWLCIRSIFIHTAVGKHDLLKMECGVRVLCISNNTSQLGLINCWSVNTIFFEDVGHLIRRDRIDRVAFGSKGDVKERAQQPPTRRNRERREGEGEGEGEGMQHSSVQSVQAANAGSYSAHATHVRTLLRAFPALLRSHSDVQTHQPKLGGIKHLRIKVVGVQRFDGSCGKQRIPLVIQLSCPATNVVEEFFATPVVLGVHAPFRVIEPNRRVLPQLEPVFQLWMMMP